MEPENADDDQELYEETGKIRCLQFLCLWGKEKFSCVESAPLASANVESKLMACLACSHASERFLTQLVSCKDKALPDVCM